MTRIEQRQGLGSVSEISQNVEALIAPMKEWVRKQVEADGKIHRQLMGAARRRLLTGTSRS